MLATTTTTTTLFVLYIDLHDTKKLDKNIERVQARAALLRLLINNHIKR